MYVYNLHNHVAQKGSIPFCSAAVVARKQASSDIEGLRLVQSMYITQNNRSETCSWSVFITEDLWNYITDYTYVCR